MIEYNANSIQTLNFRDAVRQRIAMYMGSADNQGVLQCIREIITNSIDEATMGFGDTIQITLTGNTVEVMDFGRGAPFGIREDGTEALEAIYTMPHSGGKFDNKIYQNVAGMNGIGAKGTALSSDHFMVTSYRDGKAATLVLDKGLKTSFSVRDYERVSGTTVIFIPSQEVYNLEPIKINFEDVKKMCKDWSYLCKGIKFDLYHADNKERVIYKSENGILDFIKDEVEKPIHKTPLFISFKEDNIEVEVGMVWSARRREEAHTFTNGLENPEGGTSLTGVKTALTHFFKKKFKGEFPPELIRQGLFYAVSCKVPNPSFANQTKSKVNNPELRGIAQRATTKMLEDYERRHKDEFDKVIEILTKELKAERAAERARKQVLDASKEIEKNQKKKVFASDKLKDAEFLGQNSILLIVEGDSALGGVAQARDYTRYGLLGIRGKMINCLSNPDEKIFQNEEIKLLLSAMNIVPGKYNASKLRYGKIGICVDADSDGFHIGLLIMSALAHLAPEFIKENRLCWLRAPLYIVENKGKETYYFTDEEKDKAKPKGTITRNKGLGEMTPESMQKSMFSEEFQRLDPIEYDEDALDLLYELMGVDVEPRRDFVMSKIDFSRIRE